MLGTLIKKEFLDVARGRRTLIMGLGIPLLLIPLMMVVTIKVAKATRAAAKEKTVRLLSSLMVGLRHSDAFCLKKDHS